MDIDQPQQQPQQQQDRQPQQPANQRQARGKPPGVCKVKSSKSKKQRCLEPQGLLANSVPAQAVVAYVWSAVRHIVPAALLGDRHNRR